MPGPGLTQHSHDSQSRCEMTYNMYSANTTRETQARNRTPPTFHGDTLTRIPSEKRSGRGFQTGFLTSNRLIVLGQMGKNVFVLLVGKPGTFIFLTLPSWIFQKALPPIEAFFTTAWPVLDTALQNFGRSMAKQGARFKSKVLQPVHALLQAAQTAKLHLQKLVVKITDPFLNLGKWAFNKGDQAFQLLAYLAQKANEMGTGAQKRGKQLNAWLLTPWLALLPGLQKGWQQFKHSAETLVKKIQSTLETLAHFSKTVLEPVQRAVSEASSLVVNLLQNSFEGARKYLDRGMDLIQAAWGKASQVATSITQAMIATFQVGWQALERGQKQLKEWVRPHLKKLFKLFKVAKEVGSSLYKSSKEWLKKPLLKTLHYTAIKVEVFKKIILRLMKMFSIWLLKWIKRVLQFLAKKRTDLLKWIFSKNLRSYRNKT